MYIKPETPVTYPDCWYHLQEIPETHHPPELWIASPQNT
jgi:hypothetical protein